MKASLDTNVLIHLYRANLQHIIFEFFEDGVFIYEQIRTTELENHGQDVLTAIDNDIALGKIEMYTDQKLKRLAVFTLFKKNVSENRLLYSSGDLGEVYAIALAQTIGAYSLVTDDVKQGGPYMSLLQHSYDVDIIPFTFADILILRYLFNSVDAMQTVRDFNSINIAAKLNWSFKTQIKFFINRFWADPYKDSDTQWIQSLVTSKNIKVKSKFIALRKLI